MSDSQHATGTSDPLYNVVSVYYHALKAAADAQQAGDQQFVQFFQQSQQNARQAAEQAKATLQQHLGTGTS